MAETTVPTKVDNDKDTTPATREESRYLVPPVDIYETEEGLVVVADMPGVGKDSIQVRVDDGLLTLQGEACNGVPGTPVLTEFRLMRFYRQFQLGEAVDQDKISADLSHGVLTVRLPKAEKARPRQIAVKVG